VSGAPSVPTPRRFPPLSRLAPHGRFPCSRSAALRVRGSVRCPLSPGCALLRRLARRLKSREAR
jgi:hypothetical protein